MAMQRFILVRVEKEHTFDSCCEMDGPTRQGMIQHPSSCSVWFIQTSTVFFCEDGLGDALRSVRR